MCSPKFFHLLGHSGQPHAPTSSAVRPRPRCWAMPMACTVSIISLLPQQSYRLRLKDGDITRWILCHWMIAEPCWLLLTVSSFIMLSHWDLGAVVSWPLLISNSYAILILVLSFMTCFPCDLFFSLEKGWEEHSRNMTHSWRTRRSLLDGNSSINYGTVVQSGVLEDQWKICTGSYSFIHLFFL